MGTGEIGCMGWWDPMGGTGWMGGWVRFGRWVGGCMYWYNVQVVDDCVLVRVGWMGNMHVLGVAEKCVTCSLCLLCRIQ